MTRNHKPGVMRIGPLSPGGVGAHHVQPRSDFPIPTRITNAGTQGVYTGENWQTRPGSDHSHLKSRGHGC
jgi:hypothetical protein